MLSKSGRNYLIKSAKLLRFQQGYICPDQWTIEGEMTILWLITKLGKSVRRVIRDGSLASFGTSYKGLSQCGIHLSTGAHHLFLKEDKFHSNQPVLHWQQLVCPRIPLLLNRFQSSLISLEAISKGNPTLYVTKGRDYFLWKTLAITEIAPPRSSWSYLVYIQSGLILSGHPPLCLGDSPLIPHRWK